MFIDDRVTAEERLSGLQTKRIQTQLFNSKKVGSKTKNITNMSKILNATLKIVNVVLCINKQTRQIPKKL